MDVLLDWEDELRDYDQAVELSEICAVDGGVSLCLGTSLQISPSKDLPAKASKMVCAVRCVAREGKQSRDERLRSGDSSSRGRGLAGVVYNVRGGPRIERWSNQPGIIALFKDPPRDDVIL